MKTLRKIACKLGHHHWQNLSTEVVEETLISGFFVFRAEIDKIKQHCQFCPKQRTKIQPHKVP